MIAYDLARNVPVGRQVHYVQDRKIRALKFLKNFNLQAYIVAYFN